MTAKYKPTQACCKRPPFHLPDLPLRGQIINHDELDIYVTGTSTATRGIFVIYDIFGLFPQTLYGADILAYGSPPSSLTMPVANAAITPSGVTAVPQPSQNLVFVPDLLGSAAADYSWYPPTTPAAQASLDAFFAGPADYRKTIAALVPAWHALAANYPLITSWVLVGYCWGGEVAQYAVGGGLWQEVSSAANESMVGAGSRGEDGSDTDRRGEKHVHPFKAMVLLHSGFVTEEELEVARGVKVPVLVLNSGEETEEEIKVFLQYCTSEVTVDWYREMVHGWMSARGDLGRQEVMEDFRRGYARVRDWLDEKL